MKEGLRTFVIIVTFIIGWGLTIAGFRCPPLGEIDGTVLTVLGQSLFFCAAALGFKDYIDFNINKLKK